MTHIYKFLKSIDYESIKLDKYTEDEYKALQNWYIENSVSEKYDKVFIETLFDKLKNKYKTTVDSRKPLKILKFTVKIGSESIKCNIEQAALGYWMIKLHDIKLLNKLISLKNLPMHDSLNYSLIKPIPDVDVSFLKVSDDIPYDFNTDLIFVSYNTVFPIFESDINTNHRTILCSEMRSFNDFIKNHNNYMNMYFKLLPLYNGFDITTILNKNSKYSESENNFIDKLLNLVKPKIDLLEIYQKDIDFEKERWNDQFNSKLTEHKENYDKTSLKIMEYIKKAMEPKNNWKLFIKIFIGDCLVLVK
jgi:hypothetical protein